MGAAQALKRISCLKLLIFQKRKEETTKTMQILGIKERKSSILLASSSVAIFPLLKINCLPFILDKILTREHGPQEYNSVISTPLHMRFGSKFHDAHQLLDKMLELGFRIFIQIHYSE